MSRDVIHVDGQPVRLGERIGKGGEGEVFVLAERPDQAVKLYTAPDMLRERKIEAMVAARLAAGTKLVAFPLAVARTSKGRFLGFTMQRVQGHKPLFELYAPGSRKSAFRAADYRFLIRAAANVAVAMSKVHAAGAVIGDINHSGILVSNDAVAALIDADSFQFGSFRCRVGVPEYTPPELQGMKLGDVSRSAVHDAFGLAIVIFQLLFMGRHPYVGVHRSGDMPIERAIATHHFAYSVRDTTVTPPPGTARLADFPGEIGAMFDAAFGTAPAARPDPAAWAGALRRLEGALSLCRQSPLHHFPSAAGTCPWCRMERAIGIVLFAPPLPAGGPAIDPGASGFDLAAAWRAIAAVTIPSIDQVTPMLASVAAEPSNAALALRDRLRGRRLGGLAVLLLAAALLGLNDNLWIVYLPLAWWGCVLTWGGTTDLRAFTDRHARAREAYDRAVADWQRRTGLAELIGRRAALEAAKRDFEHAPSEEKRLLGELVTHRRANQLTRHLEAHMLRRANIRGIGVGKVATLASYGIDTAADLRHDRVLGIPGFGPATAQTLMRWRHAIEASFRYNPSPTAQDKQDEERVRRDMAAKRARLRTQLAAGGKELRTAAAAVDTRLRTSDPALNRAFAESEQARADLEAVGVEASSIAAAPARSIAAPPSNPAPTPVRPAHQTAMACPACNGQMVRRVARRGSRVGRPFLSCARFPACRGSRSI